MNKYEQIKKVEESSYTLNDVYLGYQEYWDIIDKIDNDKSLFFIYQKEVNELYDIINDNIKFRSNYNSDINDYL